MKFLNILFGLFAVGAVIVKPVYSFEGTWDGMNGMIIQVLQASEYVDAGKKTEAITSVQAAIAASKSFASSDVGLLGARKTLENLLALKNSDPKSASFNTFAFQSYLRSSLRQIVNKSSSFNSGNPYRAIQIQGRTYFGKGSVQKLRVGRILGPIDTIQTNVSYAPALFKKLTLNAGLNDEYEVEVQNFEANYATPMVKARAQELDNIEIEAQSAAPNQKQTRIETWVYLSKPGTRVFSPTFGRSLSPTPAPLNEFSSK